MVTGAPPSAVGHDLVLASMRLLLIRHGQTPSNVSGALDTGMPGPGLTPLGHTQAQAIPAALAGEAIAAIHASVLIRTQLTAGPLADARSLEVTVHEGLREVSAGDLEMHTDKDSVEAYHHGLHAWADGDLRYRITGGESGVDFLERYDAAVRAIADAHDPDDPDVTVAIVSHGAAIRLWTALRARNAGLELTQTRMLNTGLAVVEGSPGTGWALSRWHGEPLGGAHLADETAHDVTGEGEDDAVADAGKTEVTR